MSPKVAQDQGRGPRCFPSASEDGREGPHVYEQELLGVVQQPGELLLFQHSNPGVGGVKRSYCGRSPVRKQVQQ
jgi:hypothetical protein